MRIHSRQIRSTSCISQPPLPLRWSARPSEIECEVMNLFEQFRNPLLRYVLSFGIAVHDA